VLRRCGLAAAPLRPQSVDPFPRRRQYTVTQVVNAMALTRDFKQTIVERVQRDPELAKALLDEGATLFLNGEADAARLVLRDPVNSTVGFEALAVETAKAAKSVHRMLPKNGNPTIDNLAAILGAIRRKLGVEIRAHTVEAA
jgi:DNA-binding phage protein